MCNVFNYSIMQLQIIEKRRRDRINACLAELRRLVPAAWERQGSQKLEKAEILQLTVEHLTTLNAQSNVLPPVTQQESSHWHSLGFRECASEVARFLASQEGLHVHHPLRTRLMGHLQCYAAQHSPPSLSESSPQISQSPSQSFSQLPYPYHQYT